MGASYLPKGREVNAGSRGRLRPRRLQARDDKRVTPAMDTVSCTAGPPTLTVGLEGGVVVELLKGKQPWLKRRGRGQAGWRRSHRDLVALSRGLSAPALYRPLGRRALFLGWGQLHLLPPHVPGGAPCAPWRGLGTALGRRLPRGQRHALSLDHPGDDARPFAFRAKQHFALHPGASRLP